METVIGFVAGYLVGAGDGKDGLARVRSSLRSIWHSPEARRLAAEAVTVARGAVSQLSEKALGPDARDLPDALARNAVTALTRKPSRAA
jgi:hypothetical protein